ncbi:hypothetical protein Tco_0461672 [Tanacetum coccineum]
MVVEVAAAVWQVVMMMMMYGVDNRFGGDVDDGGGWRGSAGVAGSGWKLRWLVPGLEMRNGEDFSYIRCVLPLMYQLMAVKKTSFLETECSGSVVASIPDVVEDQNKALSDT